MEKKPEQEEMKDVPSTPKSIVFPKRPQLASAPAGTKVKLSTNFFRLKMQSSNYIYVYAVKFPESVPEDNTPLRKRLIRGMRESLESVFGKRFIFTGTLLYSTQDKSEGPVILKTAENSVEYSIEFRRAHVISLFDITNPHKDPKKAQTANTFFNILIKSLLNSLNMVPVGRTRKYLMPSEATQINEYSLQIWPGYRTSVRLCDNGLLLEVDHVSRILSQKSALQALKELRDQVRGGDFQAEAKNFFRDKSVIAWYGNKANYPISDVDFTLNPNTYRFSTPEGMVTVIDYMKKKYGIVIKDTAQPLLVHTKRARDKPDEKVYLVPEVCGLTGLPEDIHSDFRAMKQIALYTKLSPDNRTERMQKLLKGFMRMDVDHTKKPGEALKKMPPPQPGELLANWGLTIESTPVEVEGRILPPVKLMLGDNHNMEVPSNGQFFFKQKILKPLPLNKWLLVHEGGAKSQAEEFVDVLYKASSTFGIAVEYPTYVEPRSHHASDYISAIESELKKSPNPQIVVCILSRRGVNEYEKIKRWAVTTNPPLITQMVKEYTLKNPKGLMAICSKIILQITSKRNGELWRVSIPASIPKKTMMVGIDVSRERGYTYLGFSSTYDPFFIKYYTQVHKLDAKQEISGALGNLMNKALHKFHTETGNRFLPELMVIYRDGVGESQKLELFNLEMGSIRSNIEHNFPDYAPKMIFATINKKMNTRFFTRATGGFQGGRGGRGGRSGYGGEAKHVLSNPAPGTVVHSGIVDGNMYEFLIMPQFVNEGTGTPAKVQVLYDKSGLPMETFEELTNSLCYAYDNWQGAIRTPAPCKYALSSAKLAAKYTHALPNETLLPYKYFL